MAGFNLYHPVFLQHVTAQLPAVDTSRVQADHVGGTVVPALDDEAAGRVVAEYDQFARWIVRVVPARTHEALHGRPGTDDEKLVRGRTFQAFFGVDARVDQEEIRLVDTQGQRFEPGDQGIRDRCKGFQGLQVIGPSCGNRGSGQVLAEPVRQLVVVVAEDHPRTGILDQRPDTGGVRSPGKGVARQIEEIRICPELQLGKQLFEFTGTAVNVADEQGTRGNGGLRDDQYVDANRWNRWNRWSGFLPSADRKTGRLVIPDYTRAARGGSRE